MRPNNDAGGVGRAHATAPLITTQIIKLTTDVRAPVRIALSLPIAPRPRWPRDVGRIRERVGGAL